MMFFRIFQHVLPRARAWNLTAQKQLREFFEGLAAGTGDDAKEFVDLVYLDLNPQETRALDEWEDQFGLSAGELTEQERRDRLDATWQSLGGQDPRYIQDTLRNSGFAVYIHEWWDNTSLPTVPAVAPTARNPLLLISDYAYGAGEALMQAGEDVAVAGNFVDSVGYPLVNKVFSSQKDILSLAGETFMQAGEAAATAGDYLTFTEKPIEYTVPNDPSKWPYFLYIGGVNFGDLATVDASRKNEFETLCLKICPTQQWLGILVEYV